MELGCLDGDAHRELRRVGVVVLRHVHPVIGERDAGRLWGKRPDERRDTDPATHASRTAEAYFWFM